MSEQLINYVKTHLESKGENPDDYAFIDDGEVHGELRVRWVEKEKLHKAGYTKTSDTLAKVREMVNGISYANEIHCNTDYIRRQLDQLEAELTKKGQDDG